jgi:hypothetical protein
MAIMLATDELISNPLDLLEQIAFNQNWSFDRPGEFEMDFAIKGDWGDHVFTLNWRDDLEILHLAAELDVRIPKEKRSSMIELMALVNAQMLLGHFDIWTEEGTVLFRHGLMLQGCAEATPGQCQELVNLALAACDRYYPACQYFLWAGHDPRKALSVSMFETVGNA